MQPAEQLRAMIQGRKVAFIGCGVSHKQLIPQFVKMGGEVTLCDQKASLEEFGKTGEMLKELPIRLSLGRDYLKGLEGQDIIMRTPGFEYYTPALQEAGAKGAKITSEMELFFEFCPCPLVAVTGSDGKTTTTTLIAKMFEAAGRKVWLGGNIGTPLLPLLDQVSPEDVAVVELSSFQLISMRKSPNVAVVTNVTPNHLDHHKDMQEYVDAKRNILLWQSPAGKAVLGYENDITRAMAAGGVLACAQIVVNMFGSNAEHAKDLAYRLYTVAERKGWAQEAYAYNALFIAWPEIQSRAAELQATKPEQMSLFE